MRYVSVRQKREAAAYQFEIQADKLNLTIVGLMTNYRYAIKDNYLGVELTAMVLSCSFDFYEYHINQGKQRINLLIVQRHNAVVPLRVIELTTGNDYDPGATPVIKRQRVKRRNSEEVRLFVSQLLLGLEAAEKELLTMPARTRQRYIQRCHEYLRPRVGRPFAS